MSDAVESRTVMTLRTGSKIAVMIATLFAIAAAYFYFVPVNLSTTTGAAFGCGSAAAPPSDTFPKSICLDATTINAYKAYALLAAAAATAALGFAFFGADKSLERRPVRERAVADLDD